MRSERSILSLLTTLTAGGLFILLLTTTYHHYSPQFCNFREMSSTSPSSFVPLQITLSPVPSENSLPGITYLHISLTNLSPHFISFLSWSSPFDNRAAAQGVFSFKSTKTNTAAWGLNLKLNRQLPASGHFSPEDEDIINVPANGKIEREVEIKPPEVVVMTGEEYRVKAEGNWMGVWVHDGDGGMRGRLGLGEEDGVRRGEFESNEIVVVIPEDREGEL